MVLPEDLQSRIFHLDEQISNFFGGLPREDEELGCETEMARNKQLLSILSKICALVREETAKNSPYVPELVKVVNEIFNSSVESAYGDPYEPDESRLFDFMPSWAHDDAAGQPLVKDTVKLSFPGFQSDFLQSILQGLPEPPSDLKSILTVPDPWSDAMKLHPKSSPLARPRPDLPLLTPAVSSPAAMCVYDARCEILSEPISSPVELLLSPSNNILVLNAAGGYKNRVPVLSYRFLSGSEHLTKFPDEHSVEAGLIRMAHSMALDESRKLIFVGDYDRVKSYAWGVPNGQNYQYGPDPTHTLNSSHVDGPLAVLPNEGLETHDETGSAGIGGRDKSIRDNTWRDDPEELEDSVGSSPTSRVKLADCQGLTFNGWRPLTQAPSTMLCYPDSYDCLTIDLEHDGRMAARYIGHGGKIADVSVSEADPQTFLTACSDGYARLYDLRTPLPVLTFDAACQQEGCRTTVLAHPDGVPTVFTGTDKSEQIKMWDVRARTPVYELATGNNRVQSLVWDSARNHLYAATECKYQDRMGYHHDYRPAKLSTGNGPVDKEMDGLDEDEDYPMEDDRAWPKYAWHKENYFGYMFDAGEDRIFRYAFKPDPDTSVLPEYGLANAYERSMFW
ncbi:hypothetical protein FRC09_013029 [Ceratobasidium sp. 395]|nr:hypothetical protein FRC09_013029 [Ceratobasidium sp. 395]